MSEIPPGLHAEVVLRAENRCEYCQLSQEGQEATFHIDHVVPRSVGGLTNSDNLALACVSCSLRKWAKQTAIDPETGQTVLLYNPRMKNWSEHFEWESEVVLPLTPTGRATVAALAMNRSQIVAIRMEESVRGRHPPHTSQLVIGPKRH